MCVVFVVVERNSGLKRTGKSCRLRWVNYLHPGLKRGKMTPHEERLVLELHAKWGNRWSRIARKLPGRTDNEIKNYWRTYMRKTAQDKKQKTKKPTVTSPSTSSSSSSSNSSSSSMSDSPIEDFIGPIKETDERSFYDTGGMNTTLAKTTKTTTTTPEQNKTRFELVEDSARVYSLDEIWKDIELTEENYGDFTGQQQAIVTSPIWDFCPVTTDTLWCMNEEEQSKMLMQQTVNYSYNPFY